MERDRLSARSLWYRYWFFGWLFRDAHRGTWRDREAALAYNVQRARWLPTYMRRWAVLGLTLFALGALLEASGLARAAPIAFVSACITAPVFSVALVGWVLLRAPTSAYASTRNR